MKFKVGDKVKAVCPFGSPYKITCEGWIGTVTGVIYRYRAFASDLHVTSDDGIDYPVESIYFVLLNRRRELPDWF